MSRLQTMREFLDLLAAGDLDQWGQRFTEDAVMVAVYDDEGGAPARFAGRDTIVDYFKGAVPLFGPFSFDELVVHDTGSDVAVGEWHGQAELLATGRVYDNRFIAVITFAPDGRISHYRQYRNPRAFDRASAPR